MDHDTGVFTGKIIRLISDIRAKHGKDSVNLEFCGKFTLAEDLSDISDMTSIDLSSIYSLEGRCCLEECSFLRLRTSPLFLWNIPFFGVTDSALPTLYSTSLPRDLMLLSPFVLTTATLQATSRCLKTVHS